MTEKPELAHKTLAEAFIELQGAIRPAIKDATNPAFRSKYADLGAVWEAIKPALQSNGFCVIQAPEFNLEDMWLETTILHVSGESIKGRYPIRPIKQDPQGYGSALTYARRYSISSMLGVIADDDDDGNAASKPREANAPEQTKHDPDPDGQARNWVELQKKKMAEFDRLPDLLMWQDEQEENIHRLLRKSPLLHRDLMDYFAVRQTALSKK